MMTCSKLYVTKIKYSKSLQRQKTKGEKKNSFNFAVILANKCPKTEFNPHPPYPLRTRHRRVTKYYSCCVILCHFC